MTSTFTIATHNGVFHADDVMACAMLQILHPDAHVIRTRNPRLLSAADAIIDVGGIYDPDHNRFDHHQQGFDLSRHGVKYSSAGLVWAKYGRKIVHSLRPDEYPLTYDAGAEVAHAVDEELIRGICAIDNGQALYPSEIDPLARLTSLSGIIGKMNPCWDEPGNDESRLEAFHAAVAVATAVLTRAIASCTSAVIARGLVRQKLRESEGAQLVLDAFVPWKGVVSTEEFARVTYVLFPGAGDGTWMVQAVPVSPHSFEARKPLPAEWAGLQGTELAALTGVEDAVFCHAARFICGARSQAGALKLAAQALEA